MFFQYQLCSSDTTSTCKPISCRRSDVIALSDKHKYLFSFLWQDLFFILSIFDSVTSWIKIQKCFSTADCDSTCLNLVYRYHNFKTSRCFFSGIKLSVHRISSKLIQRFRRENVTNKRTDRLLLL